MARLKIDENDVAYGKDMSTLRENDNTKTQHKATRYQLRDYSLTHKITLTRDLNEEANRDMICRLTVGDNVVLIDAEQFMRALRWV